APPRPEPQVSPGLLLQRISDRAARKPRALVVPERRVSRAEEPRIAGRAPAGDRGIAFGEIRRGPGKGSAVAARGSLRAQRGARRDPRAARIASGRGADATAAGV